MTTETTLSEKEIEAVLDQLWEDSAKWDPWVNGEMAGELNAPGLDPHADGLSPNDLKRIHKERGRIVDHHSTAHGWEVGRRMAIDTLRYRFRQATNTPDPVQEVFRESWERLSAYFDDGGSVDDLTFGPIEVVSDRL